MNASGGGSVSVSSNDTSGDTSASASYSLDEGYVLYVKGTHSYTAGPDSEYIET